MISLASALAALSTVVVFKLWCKLPVESESSHSHSKLSVTAAKAIVMLTQKLVFPGPGQGFKAWPEVLASASVQYHPALASLSSMLFKPLFLWQAPF